MGILDKLLGRVDPTDALFAAAAASNEVEVRNALDRGANPNAREPSEGQAPLHVAVRRSWKPRHAEPGVAVRTRSNLGDVASTVDVLLKAGALPGSPDNDGITPLHWAAGHGMTNVVRLLIEAGADVNTRDASSYTPLHQAVSSGHLEVARALIGAGADVNVRSSQGETALTFAEQTRAVTSAGKDPFEFRRDLLKDHPRHLKVLETAAEKSGWKNPLPKGWGRGIALQQSFGSIVAQVVDVEVTAEGKVRAHRVVCAVDCGFAVNPNGLIAQMESGAIYGLTAALYGEITIDKGAVVQSNFHDYQMLRMDEAPLLETYVVNSGEALGGAGEPGTPAIAPALTNAIFAATGTRIRELPVKNYDLKVKMRETAGHEAVGVNAV